MKLRAFLVLLFVFLISSAYAAGVFSIFQTANAVVNPMQTLRIGAGGYVRGGDIECDQGVGQCSSGIGTATKVIRTDTYGAYYWNATAPSPGNAGGTGVWQQLVSATTLPSSDPMNAIGACPGANGNTCGVWDIEVAPSNTQIAYMMLNGYVYVTSNLHSGSNASWTATGFSRDSSSSPQNGYATIEPKIAIDPQNTNDVVVCTSSNGCYYTTNGGTSWTAITGITNTSGTAMLVLFDPHSSVSGGLQQGVYICSYGTGVYHSTTGVGGTFSLTTSTPADCSHMYVDGSGIVYLSTNADTNLHVCNAGCSSWSSYSTGSSDVDMFAVDPSNSNSIIAVNSAGETSYTSTGASGTWSGYASNYSLTASDIPWLTYEESLSIGNLMLDPVAQTVYLTEGVGVWTTTPASHTTTPWTSQSAGIEQLVSNWIVSPPSGNPLVTAWDRPIFAVSSPNVYPSAYGTTPNNVCTGQVLNGGWSADWAAGSTSTIAVLATQVLGGYQDTSACAVTSGYSSNGGGSWSTFSAQTPFNPSSGQYLYGGSIAALTSSDFIWYPANNSTDSNAPSVTTNGGSSWSAVTCSGVTPPWSNGAYYLDRQTVAADRVASVYYVYNYASAGAGGGLYQITASGTCTQELSGTIDGFGGSNAQIRTVPGESGNLYYTSGQAEYPATNQSFWASTNGGGSFSAVANVKDVWSFGFGVTIGTSSAYWNAKSVTGDGYPTIYVYGYVNCGQIGTYCLNGASGYTPGLFQGVNIDGASPQWRQLTSWAVNNSIDFVKVVEGDNNTYGKVYVGFGGSGFAYGQFNFLLNRDIVPSSNDNSPVGASKVG